MNVDARKYWNATGIDVVKSRRYQVIVEGRWYDASHPCGPEGWPGTRVIAPFSFLRRARRLPWCALVGSIRRTKPYVHLQSGEFTAWDSGELFLFANDLYGFYWNNRGCLQVRVETS